MCNKLLTLISVWSQKVFFLIWLNIHINPRPCPHNKSNSLVSGISYTFIQVIWLACFLFIFFKFTCTSQPNLTFQRIKSLYSNLELNQNSYINSYMYMIAWRHHKLYKQENLNFASFNYTWPTMKRCYFQFLVKFQMDLDVHEIEGKKRGHLTMDHHAMRLYTADRPAIELIWQLLLLYRFIKADFMISADWLITLTIVYIMYTIIHCKDSALCGTSI